MTIHPHVTIGAIVTGIASALVNVIPAVAPAIAHHFGAHAETVNAAASIVTGLATIVAGFGKPPNTPAPPVQKEVPQTMSTTETPTVTKQTIIGEFVDEVLSVFDTVGKPVVEGWIANGETAGVTLLTNFLKSLPKPAGLEGELVGPIETSLETAAENYAAAAVQKYGSAAIFAVVDAQLHKWAVDLGG